MNTHTPAGALALAIALLMPLHEGHAQERTRVLPSSPLRPTSPDCTELHRAFLQIQRDIGGRVSACMRERPVFGVARGCNGPTSTAWVQCQPIVNERCHVARRESEELTTCRARASAIDAATETERVKTGRERAEANVKDAHRLADKTWYLIDLVRNPAQFLRDTTKPHPQTFKKLFGPEGQALNESTAEQVYQWIWDSTDKAQADVTRNPVIGEIQASARAHIRSTYDDLFRELDASFRDFDSRAGAPPSAAQRVAAPRPDPARTAPPATPPKQPTQATVDCSAIRDPARSRSLQARDENEWLRLVGLCA